MGYSNGKITSPVSIYDIQMALGESSADLGTLCKSSVINKWARFKPVIYPKFNALRSGVINTYHFPIPIDYDFDAITGLNITQLTQLFSDPMEIADYDTVAEVTYNKPYGGLASPYRITDFVRYNHQAQPPISIGWSDRFAVDKAMFCTCYIQSGEGDRDSITMTDIMNELVRVHGFVANKTYLCLAVMDEDNHPIWFFFSEYAYGSGQSEWSVQTRNTGDFQTLITSMVGQTVYFVAFLLYDINGNIAIGVTDDGFSAAQMNSIRTQFKVCALSFDNSGGVYNDRVSLVCQSSSASPSDQFVYVLDDQFIARTNGFYTYQGHNVNAIDISLGSFYMEIDKSLFGSIEGGQFRIKMSIGNNELAYPYNDGTTDRYEVDYQNSSRRQTYAVTDWESVRNMPKDDLGQKWRLYYNSPMNHHYTFISQILYNLYPQSGTPLNGITLYYDLSSNATGIEDIYFDIYFKAGIASQEQRVYGVKIPYDIRRGYGETPVPNS